MEKDLEDLIEKRTQQALDKEIYQKAGHIASYLGKGNRRKWRERGTDYTKEYFVFDGHEKIAIVSDYNYQQDWEMGGGGTSITIHYGSRLVFDGYGSHYFSEPDGIDSFKPGKWEVELEDLYKISIRKQRKVDKEERLKKKEEEEKKRIGERKEIEDKWK